MADRTVTTRLKLSVSDWQAGSNTVKRDLKDLNRQFAESAGFAQGFRKKLEDAAKRLPKIEIDLHSSPAEVKLAVMRDELEKLSRKTIGVDIDADAALTELTLLQGELAALDDEASFEVRASVQQALADLATVEAEARRLDGRNITLDVDTSTALGSVGELAQEAGELGGVLSRSLSVIGSVGPGQVAIVSGALMALPAVAQAAAAGIVFALGAGLATVGITAAAQSDRVKFAWAEAADAIQADLADAAEPFEGSLVRAADVAQRAFSRLQPTLARIFKDLVPDVDAFIDAVADGVVSLGPSLERIGDSFGDLLTGLADQMPAIMSNLSDAFTTFSDIMDENPQMLANMIKDATELLSVGAEVLAWADDISAVLTLPFSPEGAKNKFFEAMFGGTSDEIMAGMEQFPAIMGKFHSEAAKGISALHGLSGSGNEAAVGIRNLNSALEAHFDPAAKALDAEIRLKQALEQATQAAKTDKMNGLERLQTVQQVTQAIAAAAKAEQERTGKTNESGQAFLNQLPRLQQWAGGNKAAQDTIAALGQSLGITTMKTKDGIIAVDAFGKAVKLLPNGKKVPIDADTAKGKKQLADFLLYVARQKGEISVYVRTIYDSPSGKKALEQKARAAGAIDRYATGGIDYAAAAGMQLRPQPPQIVSKPTVLYGEGSSGMGATEAYIPYEAKYRDRAVNLLAQVANDFGLELNNKRAAQKLTDLSATIDDSGLQIVDGLTGVMGSLEATMGQTGSLTSSIDQVGASADQLNAAWQTGSDSMSNAMSEFGAITADSFTLVTASVDGLKVSVQDLVGIIQSGIMSGGKGGSKKGPNTAKTALNAAKNTLESMGLKLPNGPKGGMVEGHSAGDFVSNWSASLTQGAPVNSSRVSAPQQVPASRSTPGASGDTSAGSGGAGSAGSGGRSVNFYGTTIRESMDAQVVTAQIGQVLDSRG